MKVCNTCRAKLGRDGRPVRPRADGSITRAASGVELPLPRQFHKQDKQEPSRLVFFLYEPYSFTVIPLNLRKLLAQLYF